ncbi:hypothetical protein V1264_019207 [Littorina saxatilis]|uniref:Uncharacterized protein n=1 Tax=Littorina saxatilis TaxID=31220 RepID=A0AAN9BG24_9CAEN
MSPADGASGTCSPHLFQMYSSTPTGYSNAASPYYSTAAFLPGGTTMTNGTTMNMFGTTTCSFSAGQPPMGTGMYGVPLSRGNVGKMPTARSQNSVAYPYPM